jgi:purine nucleosidase
VRSSGIRWPIGTDSERVALLASRGQTGQDDALPRVVLDTDAFNEIDDQFALAHAALSPDRVRLEAVYAAPFHNSLSNGPEDGMRKSFEEVHRVLEVVGRPELDVFAGATDWLANRPPTRSPAATDLIDRALSNDNQPLYVVAIGAPTNVSTAIGLCPDIIGKVVVIWLGGNSLHWPSAREFNLYQDPAATRLLFDCGVALVHVPCHNVADHLVTTRAEIERHVMPAGPVGRFLSDRFAAAVRDEPGASRVIWDLAAVAWLLDTSWATTVLTDSPLLTSEVTWSRDRGRHLIGEVMDINRDAVFADLFARLARHAKVRSVPSPPSA